MNGIREFFSKTWPVIQGLLIFGASVVMVVYGVLSAPDREAIRALRKDVDATDETAEARDIKNEKESDKFTEKLDRIIELVTKIDSRVSRIEGALDK
jgi:hypothetical protein